MRSGSADTTVMLFDALEKLVQGELCKGASSLAALRAAAQVGLEAPAGLVDFHLMWLLKQGALRVIDAE